jgi:hypothetical protein
MKICNLFILTIFLSAPFSSAKADPIDKDLPQVIILGAQKSGTGAFYAILRQHPQVIDRPGEIHFFDIHFQNGIEWYKAQFSQNKNPGAIRIDKSPYYFFHPLAPKRAYSILPKAKIIILLRNPIDRAYSQYWMNIRKKKEQFSFQEAIKKEAQRLIGEEEKIILAGNTMQFSNHRHFSYLSRGIYIKQLMNWLNYYPFNQMLIISYDDFFKNPKEVIRKTLIFLELPEYDNFDFQVGKKHHYPPMDQLFRKELTDYFRQYNEQLEALLNRSFNWD